MPQQWNQDSQQREVAFRCLRSRASHTFLQESHKKELPRVRAITEDSKYNINFRKLDFYNILADEFIRDKNWIERPRIWETPEYLDPEALPAHFIKEWEELAGFSKGLIVSIQKGHHLEK